MQIIMQDDNNIINVNATFNGFHKTVSIELQKRSFEGISNREYAFLKGNRGYCVRLHFEGGTKEKENKRINN